MTPPPTITLPLSIPLLTLAAVLAVSDAQQHVPPQA